VTARRYTSSFSSVLHLQYAASGKSASPRASFARLWISFAIASKNATEARRRALTVRLPFPLHSASRDPFRESFSVGGGWTELETLRGVTPVLVFTRYSPGNIGPRNSRGGTRVRGKPEKGEQPLAPPAAPRLQPVSQLGGVFRREFGGPEVVHYTPSTAEGEESLQPVLRKPVADPKSTISSGLEFVAR
jgi:hypothetical protein